MSQKAKIEKVKLLDDCKIFIGYDKFGNPRFSNKSDEILDYLANGYRAFFNEFRAYRPAKGEWVEDEEGKREWLITENLNKGIPVGTPMPKFSEIRGKKDFLKNFPQVVCEMARQNENQSWFSALKAMKTNRSNGKIASAPAFMSYKRNGQKFVIYNRKGNKKSEYKQVGKGKGYFTLGWITKTSKSDKNKSVSLRFYVKSSQKIRRYTSVKIDVDKMTAVFVNTPASIRVKKDGRGAVGIDRGITRQLQLSNGEFFDNQRMTPQEKARFLKLQRKLSRQEKGSARREETKRLMSVLRKKSGNRADTFEHQVSSYLVKNFDTIVFENLQISKMTKSAKGTIENPGKNVSAKSGLNREILERRWYATQMKVEYKGKLAGTDVIYVDPKNTSRTCSCCGHVSAESRRSQSLFICVECGFEANADENASINILNRGLIQKR